MEFQEADKNVRDKQDAVVNLDANEDEDEEEEGGGHEDEEENPLDK